MDRRSFIIGTGFGVANSTTAATKALFAEWSALWNPPKRLPLAEWAETHFFLSSDYSAKSGTLRLYGWQREIFNSFTDPRVMEIVLKVGTQLVKTLFIQAAMAYVIKCAPGPILVSQPKDSDAQLFSKERLTPMVRDNAYLKKLIADSSSKSDTTVFKSFPGGSLSLVGAQSAANAARRTIQYYFADEINKYPLSTDDEGSFISLADERTGPFRSRAKRIYCCSPTGPKGMISLKYEQTDQRKPWVPCWHCGFFQVLNFRNGVKWEPAGTLNERAQTAHYICENCGKPWTDNQRWKSADAAEWRAEGAFWGRAGFWINHLYSRDKTMAQIALKHLQAVHSHNLEEQKVFVNTNLAEEWYERGQTPDWQQIQGRRENYPVGKLPRGVLFLTAAVDVQADRLECEVRGWGRNYHESWSITYEVIQPIKVTSDGKHVPCRTNEPEPWRELDRFLMADWPCEEGGTMPIWCLGIDTGYSAQDVYDYALRHPQPAHGPAGSRIISYRTVVPIKGGHSATKLVEAISDTDSAKKRHGLRIVTIGATAAKQIVFDSLWRGPAAHGASVLASEAKAQYVLFPEAATATATEEEDPEASAVPASDSTAGMIHFPADYGETYFKGLCAEERFLRRDGTAEFRKKPGARNEPLDLAAYNRALAELCGISRFTEETWDELEARRKAASETVTLPGFIAQQQAPRREIRGRFQI